MQGHVISTSYYDMDQSIFPALSLSLSLSLSLDVGIVTFMHTCCTWLLLYATPTHLPSICPSLRADQCPIHVPSTCTLGLDTCARHSLFGRTDPYYIDNFYSSCGLKRLAATLASPLLCNCTVLPVPLSTGPYLDANVHAAQSAPKSETAADVTNWTSE